MNDTGVGMRKVLLATAGFVAMASAAPAVAQVKVSSDVSSYLCTFAGKCGTDTQAEVPTMAAPATKGFRLATAQQVEPTMSAPRTKGFRLASGQQAQPTQAAPATKSFRIARATPAATVRPARVAPARRSLIASTRPAMTPGIGRPVAAAPRANLMLAFPYNSAELTSAAQNKARGFAQALMMPELQGKRFVIEGHTDARGAREANIDLSQRRAQSVADFLVAQGVDRSRVEVRGVGPDEPLPGHSALSEANRRVEAVLLS